MLRHELYLNEHIFAKDPDKKTTRDGFSDALLELGATNTNVVVLCADLAESTKVNTFAKKFPDKYIEMGIAEQNMAGVAAGLAMSGKIPFITSLAIFSPTRNWEQIRLSICFSYQNVKIVSTHAGLSHSFDGGMAQCLEDIALTRVLPNMTVISPADYWEAKKATLEIAKLSGPVYMRLGREATTEITTEKTPFEIGSAQVIKVGTDATIISTGTMLYEALEAAKELKAKYNVDVEVINCATIKPLDATTIVNSAAKTKLVVTIEDHQVTGGLGGAVAECLAENYPTKVIKLGVRDTFGESGKYVELKEKYGLASHHIVNSVLNARK